MSVMRSQLGDFRFTIATVLASTVGRTTVVVVAMVFAAAYSLLLPFDFTQQLSFGNWAYLDPYLVAWSLVLGILMGLLITIQVRAMKEVASAGSSSLTGFAFLASLLPSFLCCTPIVPTILAVLGFSSLGLYRTTGTIQHFFATSQTLFLVASLVLLVVTLFWSTHRYARAQCRVSASPGGPTLPNQVQPSLDQPER